MIRRLLVANRGEIALRIIRACRELEIETVAVYSDADRGAPHALAADRAFHIGPAPAAESYLSIPRLVEAARKGAADAVHPGYGFLAENQALATACEEAGLIFVGPPADVIARMGSKIEARRAMQAAGVPVVPGEVPTDQSEQAIRRAAMRLSFPVLIKAALGGGGKGMRVVQEPDELDDAIDGARREATAAFGDGTLYVERALEQPRHVEIQVFADHHGGVVHLFERDCSVQRRHQKIIEESPSPSLTLELRDRMCAAAVAAARSIGYRNAGTVEFLLEGSGENRRFYFLEMNTRLQVEHPVTEATAGVDLVRAQILVAAGEPLPWDQAALTQRGHAIECRIYAEDPAQHFLPQAGRLSLYREPSMPGVRIDSGVIEGSEVSLFYDPLLAKLIACAETRNAAIARAATALRAFPILGIHSNVCFLIRVLEHARFRDGTFSTDFLDTGGHPLCHVATAEALPAAALAAAVVHEETAATDGSLRYGARPPADPWETLRGWRS
jgi:acetyl-CoA carboxylase biotin carboxylase subunit